MGYDSLTVPLHESRAECGNAIVIVSSDGFRWTSGEDLISTWKKPGHDWQMWFCSVCGSQLPGENSASTTFIPAGSITAGDEGLKVIHHIWVDSKASWDEIGDAGRQHPEAFEG
ncbi:MAG: GFA family protein [Pseudohaliea sp.]